jgi:hypothetical protein
VFGAALYVVTLGYLMRYVFQRDVMTSDRLYSAVAGFRMLWGLWAFPLLRLTGVYPHTLDAAAFAATRTDGGVVPSNIRSPVLSDLIARP